MKMINNRIISVEEHLDLYAHLNGNIPDAGGRTRTSIFDTRPFSLQQPLGASQPFGVQQPFGMQPPPVPFGVPSPFDASVPFGASPRFGARDTFNIRRASDRLWFHELCERASRGHDAGTGSGAKPE